MANPFQPFAQFASRLLSAGPSAAGAGLGAMLKSPGGAATEFLNQTASQVFCLVVNHLLEQHRSAKSRLKPEAGKAVALALNPFRLVLRINEHGHFQASRASMGVSAPADTEIAMEWADLVGAITGPGQAARKAKLSGDMDFAQVVAGVLTDLQWDPEHDLARIVGDAQAIWIMNTFSAMGTSLQDVVTRFKASLREYVVHEKALTPTASEFESFRDDLDTLRDDLARLDKRVQRLDGGVKPAGHSA